MIFFRDPEAQRAFVKGETWLYVCCVASIAIEALAIGLGRLWHPAYSLAWLMAPVFLLGIWQSIRYLWKAARLDKERRQREQVTFTNPIVRVIKEHGLLVGTLVVILIVVGSTVFVIALQHGLVVVAVMVILVVVAITVFLAALDASHS